MTHPLLRTYIIFCYTYGLRDTGFEVLNFFGCTCSIDQIRTHGEGWADRRNAADEIPNDGFWRLTIDNLNYRNLPLFRLQIFREKNFHVNLTSYRSN